MSFFNVIMGEEPLLAPLHMLAKGESLDTGNYGEYLTSYALEHGSIPGKKFVYRNLLVPKDGAISSAENDVIMLHETGVYVFESKNYSGWIFGSADAYKWTTCLNKHTKEQFYNPIKQNAGHIKALMKRLSLSEDYFVSFIVFSERCELKKIPDNTPNCVICRRHYLVSNVKKAIKKREAVFSPEEFERVRAALDGYSEESTAEAKEAHVEAVTQIADGTICPVCGKELVERSNKKNGNTFMGCSGFPKCRYTLPLD